mmetsp:Transcript_19840/g.59942  ORF Transcript_19840/g.59942 Transcript_19840/m.59942 type:complete len:665 (-) Transcript_19840:1314-3308(-)|eukprot:CAMPEP_0206134560 /NCGR_PEP_ID=MMETSP1473-20131121/80_1 /ASSEMBLY_ACC=CAM_ASM_001109 /TAXON_ID=1461547 /ORGANISM="Stichococcus sp, Strain RCC1054" /LENGTH=664 /DNA_ID=CAMNT_0053526175 /DNA_START=244 /DNA_END=2238 /DNA_ORIENTATION=+
MADKNENTYTDEFLELPSEPGLQKVVCPPEHFISVASQDLARALRSNVDEKDRTAFAAFVRLVEATSQFEFLDVRNRLKKDFQPFAAGAARQPIPLAKREEPPTDEFLDQEELDFVCGFDALMEAAHYARLSREEWETAEREEFTFTMPVEVDWKQNDTSLLSRFWDQHPGQQEAAAEISDRILVFHRGIDTATASGLYIAEKIDLLVSYLIAGPLARLLVKQFPKLGESQLLQAVTKMGDGVEETEARPVPHQLRHKYAKVIYRSSLERQMPDTKSVFSKLFTTLQLSEPQFKSVVVLYRNVVDEKELEDKGPPQPEGQSQKDQLKGMAKEFNKNLWRRNIHIKRFEGIPIADTELIFPEKKIFLKPITILQLAVTVIGGLIAAFVTLWGSKVSMNMVMSIIVLLGGRASQVYFSANMQRQAISDAMTKGLYEKTRDSQEGVLFRLLEEMTEQHVKESLLAYIILLTSGTGRAISDHELDKQCEAYLAQRFGQRLDFDISGSLRTLLADGVVWRDSKGLLTAVSLEEAVAKLNAKWSGFFRRRRSSLAASAEGATTRNTRLARITERRSSLGGIPESEVDQTVMDRLFATSGTPGGTPGRQGSRGSEDSGGYPRPAIVPINTSTHSDGYSPSSSPGSVRHKKRISSMFKQLVPGHHGPKAIKN